MYCGVAVALSEVSLVFSKRVGCLLEGSDFLHIEDSAHVSIH